MVKGECGLSRFASRRRSSRLHRIVTRDGSPLCGAELRGDVVHLRMMAAPVRIGDELSFEIARHAGVGGARIGSAERDEFAGCGEALAGLGRDRRACGQSCSGSAAEQLQSDHSLGEPVGVHAGSLVRTADGSDKGDHLPRTVWVLLALTLSTGACKAPPEARTDMPPASAERGKAVIERVGCGSCHSISGVSWPQGKGAQALTGLNRRAWIAGTLPNRPETVAAFVRNAPALKPGTTMPAMPMSLQDSYDVAAYLYEIDS
jgi:mono/diheme cytochrome c family protein